MKKRVIAWIEKHLPLIQVFLTLVAIILATFFGVIARYLELIVTLLVLIGIDFYIFSKAYLEKITKNVEEIADALNNDHAVTITTRENFERRQSMTFL
jgi:hypothetical protein